jgi:hypothetical protein
MNEDFEEMIARIDRTSPSLAEVMPALVRLFQMHDAHIDRLDDHRARLHMRIDFLEDRMTGMEARVPGPINNTTPAALTRDLESLTAYVGLLETLINDIEKDLNKRLDVHRTDIDTLENDVSTWDDIFDNVIARIAKLERAALSKNENDRPQRDTSWHPYDVLVEGVIGDHPKGDERVVVMMRGIDEIVGPAPATYRNWDEQGDSTVIAWRYAKDGE